MEIKLKLLKKVDNFSSLYDELIKEVSKILEIEI